MLGGRRAQGAMEYVMLIGGAVLISVIVISLVRTSIFPSTNQTIGANLGQYQQALGFTPTPTPTPTPLPTWFFNTTWGGSNSDYAYDVAVDSGGNAIVVGITNSFGAGGYDSFMSKFGSG